MNSLVQKSLALVLGVLAVALSVALLVLRDLEDEPPAVPRSEASTTQLPAILPAVSGLADRLAVSSWRQLTRLTNWVSPFVTTYFRPPPPPPPPVRKTQKFQLTYQGYFETSEGVQRAYVLIDDRLAVLPPGAKVVGDVVIQQIERMKLELRQAGTQTITVPFRGTREVEVPVE